MKLSIARRCRETLRNPGDCLEAPKESKGILENPTMFYIIKNVSSEECI